MFFYKQQSGSPWLNTFLTAESWLNIQECNQLNIDHIERPNTKWVFVMFSNTEVKAVLDRQQSPLGKRPLPDWLRKLAPQRQMVSLLPFNDILCLWRCVAVDQGALPPRSTRGARELANTFFKLRSVPNIPKTSFDEFGIRSRGISTGENIYQIGLVFDILKPPTVWGYCLLRVACRIRGNEEAVACMGQVVGRTPGLFHLECEGSRMIALYMFKVLLCWWTRQQKNTFSKKGMHDEETYHLAALQSGAQWEHR